ncbi:hypothetical protein P280DRAFT_468946 [Massarina eburnea CBS 473.64]|uniref:Peptidase S54 rhomboid domain-containing protein n=1 Tax=Massarina eburnea CBS 473.64 TaxID=1395130 RepID=A0A6A6S2H8_9PLEO|nr:hypothetical protein P280DRAFT_468946 [Massarina eburnea CBS 473.64]
MSLLHRLARTLRPSSLSPARPVRPRVPSDFYTPSLNRTGLKPAARSYSRHSHYSHPPQPSFDHHYTVIYGLIGVNTSIFLYAKYAKAQADQGFPAPYLQFFQNMTLNYESLFVEGRWWTMLTSAFTHVSTMHLLGNMMSTYFFAELVAMAPAMTPARLLTLAIGSALTGSVGYIWLKHRYIHSQPTDSWGRRPRDHTHGLGFSGSVMGIGSVAACMYPRAQVLVYGIVPVPMWLLMTGYAVFDGYYLNDPSSRVGHAGHLGGLAFGILYFLTRMRSPLGRVRR